MLASTLIFGQ